MAAIRRCIKERPTVDKTQHSFRMAEVAAQLTSAGLRVRAATPEQGRPAFDILIERGTWSLWETIRIAEQVADCEDIIGVINGHHTTMTKLTFLVRL